MNLLLFRLLTIVVSLVVMFVAIFAFPEVCRVVKDMFKNSDEDDSELAMDLQYFLL